MGIPELGEKMVKFRPLLTNRFSNSLRGVGVNAVQGVGVDYAKGYVTKILMVVRYGLESPNDPPNDRRRELKAYVSEFCCF